MLQSRNLDDQNYADIVEQAVKRIPQLCSGWTNFNPSDPGITFLELFAWYKEMQQYHLNYYTEEMKLSLLKLLGESPKSARAARCTVEVRKDGKVWQRGQKMVTPEQVVFELEEEIPEKRTEVEGFYVGRGSSWRDIAPAVSGSGAVPVFSFGEEERTDFLITFGELSEKGLSVWFEMKDPGLPHRNRFRKGQPLPRRIRYELSGCGEVTPVLDETFAFSQSGFLRFSADLSPKKERIAGASSPVYWLKISLTDPGCEEQVYIRNISAERYLCSQQDTWSVLLLDKARPGERHTIVCDQAIAEEGLFLTYERKKGGWQRCEADMIRKDGKTYLTFENISPLEDGKENVMAVILDPMHVSDLTYDFSGLPDETVRLETMGKIALSENLLLLCQRNGYEEIFHCVKSLKSCGPKDRVFTYDEASREIRFGDGEHGRVPDAGKHAILCAELQLTDGKGGNIPAGSRLFFPYEEEPVRNTEAHGGRNTETVGELAARFLRKMESPKVLVSAEDYRRMALSVPGRRVLRARAVPGYDPEEPSGQSKIPVVTVIVIPAGSGERPLPDEAFLREVRGYLEEHRNIGTALKVKGPRYFPFELTCELAVSSPVSEEEVKEAVSEELGLGEGHDLADIGKTLKLAALYRILSGIPGVITVNQISIRPRNAELGITANGDLSLPPDGVPYLSKVHLSQH